MRSIDLEHAPKHEASKPRGAAGYNYMDRRRPYYGNVARRRLETAIGTPYAGFYSDFCKRASRQERDDFDHLRYLEGRHIDGKLYKENASRELTAGTFYIDAEGMIRRYGQPKRIRYPKCHEHVAEFKIDDSTTWKKVGGYWYEFKTVVVSTTSFCRDQYGNRYTRRAMLDAKALDEQTPIFIQRRFSLYQEIPVCKTTKRQLSARKVETVLHGIENRRATEVVGAQPRRVPRSWPNGSKAQLTNNEKPTLQSVDNLTSRLDRAQSVAFDKKVQRRYAGGW